jgi:hypothetical protein
MLRKTGEVRARPPRNQASSKCLTQPEGSQDLRLSFSFYGQATLKMKKQLIMDSCNFENEPPCSSEQMFYSVRPHCLPQHSLGLSPI